MDAPPAPPPTTVVPAPAESPRRGEAALAFVAALLLLLAFAGVRDLFDADEGRYGTVALDMVRSGDYVTPREHGLRFMDKPPLVYWAAAGAYAVLGATPTAARLPCIVAGATVALFAFLFAAAWTGSRRAAWAAALVFATCGGGMGFSRTVTMDMPLTACVCGALWAGWRGVAGGGRRARVGLGVAVGLGLLAKGPLAAVVPGLVALAWVAVGASWRRVLSLVASPLAWATALAVAAPWYALVERANPGYLRHFIEYEHFRRFREAGHRDFAPVWLYAAVLPLFLAPWTSALWRARLPRPVVEGVRRPVPAGRFAWAWALALLVFYSAGRNRLFTYVLPAFPPLVVLVGARVADVVGDARASRRLATAFAVLGALAALAGAAVASGVVFEAEWTLFGRRVLPLREARLQPLGLPVGLGGAALLSAPVLVRVLTTPRARLVGLVLAAAAGWWGVDLGAARVEALRSPRALARTLAQAAGPEDLVVCLDLLPQGLRFSEPGLRVAVAGKQPEIVEPWASLDGDGRLFPEAALAGLWAADRRVVLVAREKKARPFVERGGRVLARDLSGAQRADLWVVENRPRAR